MATLAFRNSYGELVDISTVAATRVKNEFAAILDQASSGGAVAITRHDTPKAVLISYAEFESLIKARTLALDDLSREFDGLLTRMQTPKAKKAVASAFSATSADLGRAAVAAEGGKSSKAKIGVRRRAR
jgi:antitoxin Phd